jgi:hypothetical protein
VAPAGVTNVLVSVSGVLQDPSTYGVVGNTITFSAAPPSGTGNISCRYLGIPVTGVTTTAYRTVTEFTATASQTTFTPPSYTVGFINVYLNGVLLGSADYTATNGTTVVLATGASAGNLVTVESFLVSSVLNAIPNTAGSVSSANIANDVTINFADGSASTPSITNNGDTNTGIFFPAADTIAFAEGGAEIARFDSSGNLGIGVTPSAWRTSFGQKSIQFGPVGFVYSLSASSTNNQTFLGSNWFLNSSGNPTYINSDYALNYSQSFGIHNWATAVQGTAGNTFSFVDVMQIDASANLKFNSGYGSAATAYGCRAWVNFNGTGTPAIRGSGNVSSITDNGTGDYTVNFTTAMPNVNYAPVIGCAAVGTNLFSASLDSAAVAVGSFRFITVNASSTLVDSSVIVASVFR